MRLPWPRRARHLARPARRRSRQPGPRVRAQPAQRRLARRRRARPPPRRLVARQVRRPARRGADRRAQGRAAEARDVHERVGPLGAARRRAFFKLEPDAVLVVHDEGDLELGRLQARLGGGLAGHNGLRSIAQHLGTPDFLRLRVGVGRPGRGDRAAARRLRARRLRAARGRRRLVARAADAVETLDAEGLEAAQRAINGKPLVTTAARRAEAAGVQRERAPVRRDPAAGPRAAARRGLPRSRDAQPPDTRGGGAARALLTWAQPTVERGALRTCARRPRREPLCVRSHSLCAARARPRRLPRRPRRRRASAATATTTHAARARRRAQARVVRFARQLLGVRYAYGGTSPRSGFDCSGFIRFVYAHFGVALPHYSVRAVRPRPPRRARGAAARRPRLLRRARPRRHLHRRRPLHPRAAHRHQRLDRLARRLVREPLRRRPRASSERTYHDDPAERVVRPIVMDRPVLYSTRRAPARGGAAAAVRRRAADARARLRAGAAARARRAARGARPRARRAAAGGRRRARRRRGGRLVPRRRAGRAAARRAASAGAPGSSRRRTSSASGRARSTCSRAAASSARRRSRVAEGLPPAAARPAPLRIAPGDEPGHRRRSPSSSRSAGYERVERVEERGQFAVRGGLVDVFPTTGREPLRIELFGDEIEQIRAFSPFTQRALRQVERRRSIRRPSAARELVEIDARRRRGRGRAAVDVPDDLVPPFDRAPDLVWQPDEVRAVWAEEGLDADRARRARPSSTRCRRASRSRSTRSGRRSPRAGSPRPRTS